MVEERESKTVKAEIKKHPLAWVVGAAIVGGLFLSNFIKGGAASIRRKV